MYATFIDLTQKCNHELISVLNKIPPSVERDGMFYISRKEIELIKEILNSRDKIVINGLHFLSIHLKALVAYSTTKTTTGKTTMIMLKQK